MGRFSSTGLKTKMTHLSDINGSPFFHSIRALYHASSLKFIWLGNAVPTLASLVIRRHRRVRVRIWLLRERRTSSHFPDLWPEKQVISAPIHTLESSNYELSNEYTIMGCLLEFRARERQAVSGTGLREVKSAKIPYYITI